MVIQTWYVEDKPTGKMKPASQQLQSASPERRGDSRDSLRAASAGPDLCHPTMKAPPHPSQPPILPSKPQRMISALRCDLRAWRVGKGKKGTAKKQKGRCWGSSGMTCHMRSSRPQLLCRDFCHTCEQSARLHSASALCIVKPRALWSQTPTTGVSPCGKQA